MTSPIGLNVHAQSLSGSEKHKLVDLAKDHQPTTMVVMDDFSLAVEVKRQVPNCTVIYRDNDSGGNDGAHLRFTPNQVVDGYKRAFDYGLVAYIENEQNWGTRNLGWLADVANLAYHRYRGLCCLGNFAVGQPETDVITSGRVDDLIKLCISQGHYFGLHEGGMSHDHWLDGYPYFVGRFKHLQTRQQMIAPSNRPWIIMTEWCWDSPDASKRGILNYISRWFNQGRIDPQAYAFEQLRDVWKYVYNPSGCVLGIDLYCYGAVAPKWESYDFRLTPTLMKRIGEYQWRIDTVNNTILVGTYRTSGTAVNVRDMPAGTRVGSLPIDSMIVLTGVVENDIPLNGIKYLWRQMSDGLWFAHVDSLVLTPALSPPVDKIALIRQHLQDALTLLDSLD